jgi:hypothetical protein
VVSDQTQQVHKQRCWLFMAQKMLRNVPFDPDEQSIINQSIDESHYVQELVLVSFDDGDIPDKPVLRTD